MSRIKVEYTYELFEDSKDPNKLLAQLLLEDGICRVDPYPWSFRILKNPYSMTYEFSWDEKDHIKKEEITNGNVRIAGLLPRDHRSRTDSGSHIRQSFSCRPCQEGRLLL